MDPPWTRLASVMYPRAPTGDGIAHRGNHPRHFPASNAAEKIDCGRGEPIVNVV